MSALIQHIALWVALWVGGGIAFVLLVRRGTNYVDHFALTSVSFLAFAALVAIPFARLLEPEIAELGWKQLALFGAAIVVQGAAYAAARHALPAPSGFIRSHPHIYFLRLDYRYLISKPCEILFQQVLIASLVLLLAEAGLGTLRIVGLAVLVFAIVHIPLFRLVGPFFGAFYMGWAGVAAALFSVLILSVEGGIAYAFLLHWLFYTIAGIGFWWALDRRTSAMPPA